MAAGAFTNQPRVTPIYNPQQAAQLGKGDFSSLNGAPGAQGGYGGGAGGVPGGQGGSGGGGNTYLLGGGMGYTTVYATVKSGQPIIINPETGKPYPPGYIPEIQDPSTHEEWRPGDSLADSQKLADAALAEKKREGIEIFIRPFEEKVSEDLTNLKAGAGNAFVNTARKGAELLYGKDNKTLKEIQGRIGTAGEQAIKQAPQVAQSALTTGLKLAGQAGQATQNAFSSGQPRAGEAQISVAPERPAASFSQGTSSQAPATGTPSARFKRN
ncbi:hypothetical protein [Microcoleus sp. bin38.metabat.b11b12b14.051]|uniref:hypothetical protein n=1 Tax=Microcoleus sp. bin38.metabat.b11b12b14.051 TaxID=2742709 RepID=UPI0025D7E6B3|nr:hypothetical protein [Microcoleus sp. bin38.metabat.b11b12b14.051]